MSPTKTLFAVLVLATLSAAQTVQLHQGWTLQSSRKITATGDTISTAAFRPKDWYRTTVPTTVVAAQVASGQYPDPYFGMNLRRMPGMDYPVGFNNFNELPMDPSSPYAVAWWYRSQFQVPPSYKGKSLWLHFNGINYRANIWINGRKLADAKDVAGAYRRYEFNVTSFLHPGQPNVLALEIFAPTQTELGINWVDWNPAPPDKDMGIWGDVYLTASGPVSVRYPQVITHFANGGLDQADLTVTAQLQNTSAEEIKGVVEAELDHVTVKQEVTLPPNQTQSVRFTPEQFPALQWKQPKLWWPSEMGTPNLHDVTMRFTTNGTISDQQHARFGIREITSELTDGHRLFRVNGKKILIRGAAWSMDMLLRPEMARLDDQFQYIQDLHLNTIRLEAQLEVEKFFDLADEKGILVMAGWCCCDFWEHWEKWQPETLVVATDSLRTQALRLRSHPSLLVWLTGSDGPPPANVETAYRDVLKDVDWPNPIISSASDTPTTVSGESGVKMTGPYDYEPPSYWLTDKKKKWGGAWGFNTETGPGEAIPPLESLRKFIPKDHLWPMDQAWSYHSAGERFATLDRYNQAMNATYGKPSTLDDYLRKSQAMAYDGERAMFEAYSKNKYEATGVIQWMLNNAWPSLYWHLYDFYLYPAGGYFGTRKACEPLHVQYSYDDRSVVVVNSRQERVAGLTVRAEVYDFDLKKVFSGDAKLDSEPDSSTSVLTLPAFPETPSVYFVRLELRNQDGREVSSNFYWLPARLSDIGFDETKDTDFTPIMTFEDMTALNRLPSVHLQATARQEKADTVRITVRNPGKTLAFQVHVGVRLPNSEDEILPVVWEDNYFSLMPGESRTVTASFLHRGALDKGGNAVVDGWNIAPTKAPLTKK